MKRAVIDSTEDRITSAAVAGSSTKLVAAGSVLCVMRSGILRHTFPVAVAAVDVTLNQDMRALTPPPAIDPFFLAYYLRCTGQTVLETSSKGGTTVNSIEAERLDRHPVPIPTIEVQRAIVAHIDELFTDLDNGEAALALARADLGTWRKALLKAAVTGELTADWRAANPPTETGADLLARILDERRERWVADPRKQGKRYADPAAPAKTDLPRIPDSWTWVSIEQLTTGGIRNGLSVKESLKPTDVRGLRLDALRSDGIDWSRTRYLPITLERASNYLLSAGDLLVSRANGSPEFLGRCSLVSKGRHDTVFPDTAIRYPLWGDQHFHGWVKTAWSSPSSRQKILKFAKSTAGILKISQSDIAAVPLPLPPWSELIEIDALVSRMLAEADSEYDYLNTISIIPATLRQSILAAAFRGELVT